MRSLILILIALSSFSVSAQMARNKILIVVTSNDSLKNGQPAGYFLPEVVDYYQTISKLGYQIDFASPKGGLAPMYERLSFIKYYNQLLKKDHKGFQSLVDQLDHTVELSKVDPNAYIAVHCVGGFATLFDFPTEQSLKTIIKNVHSNGGIVSAVCHGPSALLNIQLDNGKYLLDGLKVTARSTEEETDGNALSSEQLLERFPMLLEDELKKQGAVFKKGDPYTPYVEVADRIVTGQNEFSTVLLGEKVAKLLKKL